MTRPELAWGPQPSARFETVAAQYRSLFDRIREGALARELDRRLPVEEIAELKRAGFGALRVPREHGGAGLSLPEFFAVLIELSEADSNITQSLRAHFGFVEDALTAADHERSVRWLERVGKGALVGGAWSEVGEAKQAAFSTKVSGPPGALRLDGRKYYSTGALFSDWVDVGATDEAGEGVNATVLRTASGVEILDDWDGIGQALTASGTAIFHDVAIEPGEVRKAKGRFPWSPAFFQLVHLATLAGIGRALTGELAAAVARRDRSYSHAAANRPAEDPQVLQVVGRVRSLAYAAGPIVLAAAAALERATASADDPERLAAAIATSEIEAAQAQIAVIDLVLQAGTLAFDALGASAVRRSFGLDRHWRNARTLASHNPRIYKERIVGDYAVNGAPPPAQWRIGKPE
jgi:alkylation response protein AidB-like acyl-CoA dehydrogenase